MNEIKEKLQRYNFKINSLKYIGKVIIIDTNQGKFVYKDKNNYLVYEYLISRGFSYFPKQINDSDTNYDLVEYIDSKDIPKEQKLNDLINIVSYLHKKTSFYKEIDLNELKKMYEKIENDTNYLMSYYKDLNNYIDNITFMSPAMYLLVRNIDLFYYLISFIKVENTNWYKNILNKKNIRYCMINNNLDINHVLENNSCYLANWNKAIIDFPYKDIKQIFEKYFYDLDIENTINEYLKNNKLDNNEYLFMLINLAIPKKVEFTNNTYLDTYNLSNYIEYLRKIVLLIQNYDKNKHKV